MDDITTVPEALDELLEQGSACGRLPWFEAPTPPNRFVSPAEEAQASAAGAMWVLQHPEGQLFASSPEALDARLAALSTFADHPRFKSAGPVIRKVGEYWRIEGEKAGIIARGPDLRQLLNDLLSEAM